MMASNEKFCCFGTYNPRLQRCLVMCPFNFDCKLTKYEEEIINSVKEENKDEQQDNQR